MRTDSAAAGEDNPPAAVGLGLVKRDDRFDHLGQFHGVFGFDRHGDDHAAVIGGQATAHLLSGHVRTREALIVGAHKLGPFSDGDVVFVVGNNPLRGAENRGCCAGDNRVLRAEEGTVFVTADGCDDRRVHPGGQTGQTEAGKHGRVPTVGVDDINVPVDLVQAKCRGAR